MLPLQTLSLFLLPSLVCACASATGEFVPLGPDHPANPAAHELPIEDPSAFLREERAPEASPPADAGANAPPDGAYVCPMHADVTSEGPGSCPKCGMKLVPRGEEQPHES